MTFHVSRSVRMCALLLAFIALVSGSSRTEAPPRSMAAVTLPIAAAHAPTGQLPAACADAYATLLDVATVARSYGSAASQFVDVIGELAWQLGDCMSNAATGHSPDMRAVPAAPGVDDRHRPSSLDETARLQT